MDSRSHEELVPIQIPDDAWPKKEQSDIHLEKVTDPLVALQIAVGKSDQASIDHYCDLVVASGDKAVPALKQLLASSKDRAAVKLYAYALSKIGTKAAVTALIDAANATDDKDLRDLFEGFIKDVKTKDGVTALLDGLSSGEEAKAVLCSRVLSRRDDPEALGALVALSSHSDEYARTWSLYALGELSASEQTPALQQLAMGDDPGVAAAAIHALASQSTEDAVQLLLNSFNQYPPLPDPERFSVVVEEMRRMLQENPEKPGLAITVESLMTTSPSELTRAAAVAALQESAAADVEKLAYALNKAYQYEESDLVRQYLEDAMTRLPAMDRAPVGL